jgi:DNA end-binding protein Ku
MARAIWKGTVAFGLVSMPVEAHKAVSDHRPHFKLLCAGGRSPVKYERICQRSGKPVSWKDLVKGYEYQKGKFVTLTREDFETAALEKSQTIDIVDFVEASEVDDRYFERPYYLRPSRGGESTYTLLRAALRESGKIGIGKMIMRQVQHLVSLTVVEHALTLNLMRFADEILDPAELSFPPEKRVEAKQLGLAVSIIEGLSDRWDPAKYTDEYRDNLMRVIKAKIKGREPKLKEDLPRHEAEVVDLMERLRASLEVRGRARSTKRKTKSKRKRGRAA